jgi:uncharacterized membrane protein YedE/YeeE
VSAFIALISGCIFAAGLAVSGMTDGNNIVAFLDITGDWDPNLAWVMVGAIGVHGAMIPLFKRRATPRFREVYPTSRSGGVDARLLAGAVVFGAGWGIGGICPGPSLVMLPSGSAPIVVFTVSMLAAIWSYDRWVAPRVAPEPQRPA